MFFRRITSRSKLLDCSLFLLPMVDSPAVEKTRPIGADEAGMHTSHAHGPNTT